MRFVAVLGLVLLAGATALGAEKGAAAGSGNALLIDTKSKLAVEDLPGHELVQAMGDDEIKTPDKIAGVSFDGAKAKIYRQSDLVDGSGTVRGYATWEAKTGQKLFMVFGYAVPPFVVGREFMPFEGTFEWIGGTGALKNVHGKGSLEGEISKRGETHYRWAGSYQIGK
ncbi:MAG: hypothetical protein ACREQQ_16405 [Candidatus Binatia bacterium]